MLRKMKHGYATDSGRGALYFSWQSMKKRCLNPNTPGYKNWGGRGITICDRWMEFINFAADMEPKPNGMTLERKDNNGPYSPDNCKWATRKEQQSNTQRSRLIEFNGETLCLGEWERKLGLGVGTIWRRLAKGLPVEKALRRIEK
ncbi:MAG: hypothetical protein V1784_03730 [bacterium]